MAIAKTPGVAPVIRANPGAKYKVNSGGAYGKPIPVVYGTAKVTGSPVLVLDPRETIMPRPGSNDGVRPTFQIEPMYKSVSAPSGGNQGVSMGYVAPNSQDQLLTRWIATEANGDPNPQVEISMAGGKCKAPVAGPVASAVYVFCEGPILAWGPWFWRGSDRIWWLNITGTSGDDAWPNDGTDVLKPESWKAENYSFRMGERLDDWWVPSGPMGLGTYVPSPTDLVSDQFRVMSQNTTRAEVRWWGYGLASLCVNELSLLNGSLPEISVEMIGLLGYINDDTCFIGGDGVAYNYPYQFVGTGKPDGADTVGNANYHKYDMVYYAGSVERGFAGYLPPITALDAGPEMVIVGEGIYDSVTDTYVQRNGFLTDQEFGLSWPVEWIQYDTGIDGGSTSSYQYYVQAMGWGVSNAITEQVETAALLANLLESTNSTCVWSEGRLKLLPLGNTQINGNINQYDPPVAIWDLVRSDFLQQDNEEMPITVTRSSTAEIENVFPVRFTSRYDEYNMVEVEYQDQGNVDENEAPFSTGPGFGVKRAEPSNYAWISKYRHAMQISALKAQTAQIERCLYTFRLAWRFARLEPGDIVTITEPLLGLNYQPVRILSIEAGENYDLTITATDFGSNAGSFADYPYRPAGVTEGDWTAHLATELPATSRQTKSVPQTNLINYQTNDGSGSGGSSGGGGGGSTSLDLLRMQVSTIALDVQSMKSTISQLVAGNGNSSGTTADPYDLMGYVPGLLVADQTMAVIFIDRNIAIQQHWAGCHAVCEVAATVQTVFTIYRSGTAIGTITFQANSTTGSFSTSGSILSFADGQILKIVGPANPDGYFSGLSFSLTATRVV